MIPGMDWSALSTPVALVMATVAVILESRHRARRNGNGNGNGNGHSLKHAAILADVVGEIKALRRSHSDFANRVDRDSRASADRLTEMHSKTIASIDAMTVGVGKTAVEVIRVIRAEADIQRKITSPKTDED